MAKNLLIQNKNHKFEKLDIDLCNRLFNLKN